MNSPEDSASDSKVGRTGIDALYDVRYYILAAIVIIGIVVGVIAVSMSGTDLSVIGEIITEYWPVAAGPVFGYFCVRFLIRKFYDVESVEVSVFDTSSMTPHLYLIPRVRFSNFNKPKNNVVLVSGLGRTYYSAVSIDLEKDHIEFSWIHTEDPQKVIANLDTYSKWAVDSEQTKADYELLKNSTRLFARDMATDIIRPVLDMIWSRIDVKDPSVRSEDSTVENAASPGAPAGASSEEGKEAKNVKD